MGLKVALLAGLSLAAPARAEPATPPTMAVAWEPAGYAAYPIPSRGAELTYFLADGRALGLNYAQGSATQLLATYEVRQLLVRYRLPVGDLSHVNFGAGYRDMGYRYTTRAGGQTSEVELAAAVVGGELSFGSRLGIGPVMVGCDWLGVLVPVTTTATKKNLPESAPADDAVEYDRAYRQVSTLPTLQFMRFSIGAVF